MNSNLKEEELSEETRLTKDIAIKNFSSIEHSKETRTYFVVKNSSRPVVFCVSVYPNGISLQTEGRISIQFLKFFIDNSDSIYVHNVLWMLSIVDVNGHGHYCQSFTNENITGYPYNLVVSNFLKRSVIEDNADLLSPDDVLTVRCELFYTSKRELRNSYLKALPSTLKKSWYLLYNRIYAKEIWKPPLLPVKNFDGFEDSDLIQAIRLNLNYRYPGVGCRIISFCRNMDTIMEMFLKKFLTYISFMTLSDLECQLDVYAKSILKDEFCDTYIPCNCIFQTYIVCKQIYREEFNKTPLDRNMLNPGYIFFFKWLHIPLMKMNKKYLHFSDVPLNDESKKENQPQLYVMDERRFIEEVIETCKIQSLSESSCSGWNCIRDAFVYLLIDEDMLGVSENVLRYPVRDYRVNAIDMDCQINFLNFLHDGTIQAKSMTSLCKLYKMAEEYNVEHLRYLCAQEMKSFFSKDNIDSVKKIRHATDHYLKRMIDSFESANTQDEGKYILVKRAVYLQ
ncbi:hypothetical protein AVEN_54367-1 [Araneus ventricosus]|uniref:BTB domain-containing protein n=1 Tax=Araneus ventricosus TaxID=182803 RepID=A0A4Y2SB39_ARAVE|nr:hypothetical protein AVEN_119174-1 [Araneus ventricosus]GBN84849.1 hypothetical protein AVEN_54367-1 [Araneus ventricosus]